MLINNSMHSAVNALVALVDRHYRGDGLKIMGHRDYIRIMDEFGDHFMDYW